MSRFTISTWADSRSNRRDRTYIIHAMSAADAKNEAIQRACHDLRQWGRTIETMITDVDGKGAPTDCSHADSILLGGFVLRADGGRDCRECAAQVPPLCRGCQQRPCQCDGGWQAQQYESGPRRARTT